MPPVLVLFFRISSSSRNAAQRLHATTQSIGLYVPLMFDAVSTFGFMLLPLTPNVPSPETLMAWVVACEMAILLEPLLFVAARDEMNLLIVAHGD
jgi:hypothetical protein